MENHGKENYEKLNEHGKSKEKQSIIMKLKNNKISLFPKHLFLDHII